MVAEFGIVRRSRTARRGKTGFASLIGMSEMFLLFFLGWDTRREGGELIYVWWRDYAEGEADAIYKAKQCLFDIAACELVSA